MLVASDFNTNFLAPEGRTLDKYIMEAMDAAGLECISCNFLLRHKSWLKDVRTWCMRHGGRGAHSLTD